MSRSSLALIATLFLAILPGCNATTGSARHEVSAMTLQSSEATQVAYVEESNSAVPALHLFRGQGRASLAEWFGTPDLVRREGEATIVQYRTEARQGACVLIAVLYEARGVDPAIRHLSVRQNREEMQKPEACLAALAQAHRYARLS